MKRNISTPEAVCRSRQQHYPLVRFLALIVAVCSVFSLIPPVSVMAESEPAANCPLVIHQHDETCYSSENEIICGTADYVVHTHGANCYAPDASLVCELAEIEAHAHGDACFSADQTLICEKEVIVLHTHSDGCRDAEDHLICGLLEVVEHIHSEGCYAATAADTTPAETTIATTAATEATGAAETTEATEAAKVTEATEAAVTKFNAVAPVSGQIIASGTCGDSASWTLTDDGALTISGEGSIKNYLYNYAPWLENSSLVTSLTIREGITSIGSYAFCNCTNLTSVSLPDNLTSIGSSAFSSCSSLTSISLPDGLTSISQSVFKSCSSLTGISIGNNVTSIGNSAFSGCTSLTSVSIGCGVISIGNAAFSGCTSLTDITIPDNVTSLGHTVFRNCTGLTSASIGNGIESIDDSTFSDCTSLTNVSIGSGVTSIGDYAFSGCSSLPTVSIGSGVTSIGDYAFSGCSSLSTVSIGSGVTSIGKYAFSNCDNLNSVSIACNVTTMGSYTFNDCDNLTSVTITSNTVTFGDYAFYSCEKLESISLPDEVTSIGNYAFYNCSSLTDFTAPNIVSSIGSYAFYRCSGLTSVAIPAGLTSIEPGTFSYCGNLTSITIPENVTFIGKQAFSGCYNLAGFTLPENITSIEASTFNNCSSLTSIAIPENVTSIGSSAFSGCTGLTSIIIPENVTTIGGSAFSGCKNLSNINIPSDVTVIGGYTFRDCTNLASIDIPDGVTSIGNFAFYGCTGLTTIAIAENVESIGISAFRDCTGLTEITIPEKVTAIAASTFSGCSNLTSISLPDSITSIGSHAFYECTQLTDITIPKNVTSIGDSAFYNCRGIPSFSLPAGLMSIGSDAFNRCDMTEISIPQTVTAIGSSAFKYCDNLTSIVIPQSITSISDSTFYQCFNLASVSLPEGLESIGNSAFASCINLANISIPQSVTHIGNSAFSSCRKLTSITIPPDVTSIGASTFQGCRGLTSITLHEGITSVGSSAFGRCSGLTNVTLENGLVNLAVDAFAECVELNLVTLGSQVDAIHFDVLNALDAGADGVLELSFTGPNHLQYSGEDIFLEKYALTEGDYYADTSGVLYRLNSDGTATLIYCPNGLAEEYTVLSAIVSEDGSKTYSVTAIAETAFKNCIELKEVAIPDSVTAIGNNAFENCISLTGVSLGQGVSTIGNYAFLNCSNLKQITIPGSVHTIGHYAFQDCTALSQVSLLDGISTIGHYAFQNCHGITQLTIPESVTSLGNFAFYNCTQLSCVNGETSLPGTLAAWSRAGANSTTFQSTALSGESTDPPTQTIFFRENTNDPANPGRLIQISTERFQALTGETVDIVLAIEGGANDSTSVVRFYFQFIDEHGDLGHSVGDPFFDKIHARVCETDVPNTYFIEVQPLKAGETFDLLLTPSYEKGISGGGPALIWASAMSTDEAEKLGNRVTVPEDTIEIIWQTQPNTFSLTKTASVTDPSFKGNGDPLCNPSVENLYYHITMNRVGDALNYGQDHVTSVDYVDTLSLPDGFYWRPGLSQAITNGDWYVETDSDIRSSYYYIYITADETTYLFATISVGSSSLLTDVGLNADAKGNILILWTHRNPDLAYDIPALSPYISFGDEVILANPQDLDSQVSQANAPITVSFDNTVTATLHYSYSEDQVLQASASKKLPIAGADYKISKSADRSVYMGNSAPYRITLRNITPLPYTTLSHVTDDVPDYFYISAGDLETMFYKDTYGKYLSVTINHADICGPTPVCHEVVNSEGNAYILTQQLEGINTPHDGKYSQGIDESISEANKAFVIGWSQDKTHLVLEKGSIAGGIFVSETAYPIGPGYQYTSIQQALDDIGFIITKNTAYTCRWDQVGQTLYGGESRVFYIRTTAKDTFMRLLGDQDLHIVDNTTYASSVSNYVRSYSTDTTYKSNSHEVYSIYRDFVLSKKAYLNDKAVTESTLLLSGDVLTYRTTVAHNGFASYEALPLVDHMAGAQVLLVSAEANRHLVGRNLTTTTVNGTEYYILNREGIYEGVQVGTHWADQVKIESTAAGIETLIYWYLADVSGHTTVTVEYPALISPEHASFAIEAESYPLSNEVWLNDHQTHRLYANTLFNGTVLKMNKYIVTSLPSDGSGDLPAYDLSPDVLTKSSVITSGETVTYRLMLQALGDASHTVQGSDMFDILPASLNNYWNDQNVTVTYVPALGSTVEIKNPDSWWIETDALDSSQQYLRWNKDFSATIDGTLYIYVTLTFPAGAQWSDFCSVYGSTNVANAFQVYHLQDSVSHIPSIQSSVMLQKDVLQTRQHPDYVNPRKDSLWFYTNSAQNSGLVIYSITLYNSGENRVYLSDIQDVLPQGFTFGALCNSSSCDDGVYLGNSYSNSGYKDSLISIQGPRNDITFKTAYITATTNKTGKQVVVTFSLSNGGNGSNLCFDEELKKYYLNPGEAVVIAYQCYTNFYKDTLDDATNIVSMPFYDYNGAGVHFDTDTVIDRKNPGEIISNSGNQFLATNGQAALWGMDTRKTDDSTQWISSEVTIYRGNIQPGITKTAEAPYAHAFNPVEWTIRISNSGTENMRDYIVTDVMMNPYQFVGTVSYKIGYDAHANISAYSENLFTFGAYTIDGEQVTVPITSPTGDTAVLTVNGGYQEITTSITAQYTTITTIKVRLSQDEKDNNVLSIVFPGDERLVNIPAHGYGILTLQTQNLSEHYTCTTFHNTAYITPSKAQLFNTAAVSQGNYTLYNGAGSVVSEDNVAVSYGYSTSSVKSVAERNNNSNSAKSTDATNYIVLDEASAPFRYSLTVENTGGTSISKAMDLFILIDNLPQPDDHATFFPDVPRFSDFRVNFQENLNFVVKVNGATLDDNAYTLQFTTATEFQDADLKGTSTNGWYTLDQIDADASLSLKDMRSFRVLVQDDSGTIIPAKAVITAEFNAEADLSQGNVLPSSTAWNSFIYSYSLVNDPLVLSASPQKVGVRIASVPALVKQLQYAEGGLCPAKEDATFRFVIYKGPAVALPDNFTEADVFSALADLPFTVAELTVRAGETTSETRSLDGMYCYRYENGSLEQTDTGWVWEKGNEYTLLELPLTDRTYQFGSFNKTNSNNCTFTYNTAIPQTFTCVNVQSLWNILVEKQCQSAGTPLPGAFFGLYSPSGDELISDEKFTELSAQLKTAPQRMLTIDSSTWYLMDIQATADNGQIQWRNLGEDAYYLLELQSPKGYILSSQPGQTVRKVTGGTAFVTVTNLPAQDLPYVGGPGTAVLYGAGVGLTGVSLLLGWQKKRKSRKNSNT